MAAQKKQVGFTETLATKVSKVTQAEIDLITKKSGVTTASWLRQAVQAELARAQREEAFEVLTEALERIERRLLVVAQLQKPAEIDEILKILRPEKRS